MGRPQDILKMGWLFIEGISFLEASIILWETCCINDINNDTMVSVDGTDMAVPQFKPFWKGWYSHKLNGPGTQWEVGLCIHSHKLSGSMAHSLVATGLT